MSLLLLLLLLLFLAGSWACVEEACCVCRSTAKLRRAPRVQPAVLRAAACGPPMCCIVIRHY
jgi:hypothetical protein